LLILHFSSHLLIVFFKNCIMTRMFQKTGLCVLILLAFSPFNSLLAQGRQVIGTVTSSENSQPVPGATVTVKGTRISVSTDAQGKFRITANANATTLVVTHTGFAAFEVAIGANNTADARLVPEVKALEDVVVIGYQTIRRKDLLASVSSVGAKDLKDIPINNAAEALNGRLAGVTATTSEGSPDANIRVRVRGGMSITGSNEPLYVIDGVQVESGLSTISPQDIQSIDVLKDAAATAIYGARGANGVIIITTKSGKPGRLIVNYNGFIGIKKLAERLDVLSPYEFVIYQLERSRAAGGQDSLNFLNNFGTTFDTLKAYKDVDAVDWQGEVFGRTGVTQTHNVSASGGTQKITYNFGYTFNDDKAIVLNSSYRRHLINFKSDYNVTKNLKVGVTGRYTLQNVYGSGVSSESGTSLNRLRNTIRYRPFLSNAQDIDDNDPLNEPSVGNGLILVNPVSLTYAEYRRKTTDAYNITANLQYTILKNLSFKSTFGYDRNERTDRQFYDTLAPLSIQNGKKPIVTLDTSESKIITNSNVLSYSVKGWKKHHNFDFLVGQETYDLQVETHTTQVRNYPFGIAYNDAFKQQDQGQVVTGYPRVSESRFTQLSFFGRVTYSFKDKILMSANVRRDGASKFAADNRWGTFPAGSIAWRLKQENFMKNVNFISDMKLRFGIGKMGNNRIRDYLYQNIFAASGSRYYGLNGQPVIAYVPTSLPNELLTWESTINRNYGLDVTLFNRRVDLSVDYYDNSSEDLLLNVNIDPTYGFTTQQQNVGKTSNKGFEIQLSAIILRNPQGLNWTANFNIAHNKNEVVRLGPGQTETFPGASWGVAGQPTDYILRIGEPLGSMYGLVNAGFYQVSDFNYNTTTGAYTLRPGVPTNVGIIGTVQPGSIKYSDLNGDGVIDLNNDRKIIGNPNPKLTGGLSQQFGYRNFDLSLFVNFMLDFDVYNANKIELTNAYSNNSNMLGIMRDRWTTLRPDGSNAQWVRGGVAYGIAPDQLTALNSNAKIWHPLVSTGAFIPHSWAIEDGSFLRLNNITVGYSLPVKGISRLHLSKLRFYVTANNLAIITNYSGYDPEVNVRSDARTPNLDYSAYPKSRSFIFGINASF
jgi:TonB-dependent starch-binding outer membrane protein SusC